MAVKPNDVDIKLGMRCWCGSLLHLDAEHDQYICTDCGKPEDECECDYH